MPLAPFPRRQGWILGPRILTESDRDHLFGRRSVRYVQKMTNLRTEDLAASFDTIEALFDFTVRKSIPWPDDLRAEVESRIVEMSEEDKAHFDG